MFETPEERREHLAEVMGTTTICPTCGNTPFLGECGREDCDKAEEEQ